MKKYQKRDTCIVATQRTEPLWRGKTPGSSEGTTVNVILQQEQELAKQGKEIQGRAKAKKYKIRQQ